MSDEKYTSEEDVAAALEAAARQDAGESAPEQAPASPPADAPAGSDAVDPVQPAAAEPAPVDRTLEGVSEPAPASADTPLDVFEGTPINPDELPDELKPLAKQLQAAFTQKTQTLAEQRKQFDELGSPEDLQQATELYSRIQDPNNWVELHRELTSALNELGMSPEDVPAGEQAPAAPGMPDLSELDDPEMAPFKQAFETLKSQMDTLQSEREQQRSTEEAERQRAVFMGEVTRMENAIRQANPSLRDDDVDISYELSSFYGGNLMDAHQRLEQYVADRFSAYLAQKEAAAQTEAVTSPTPATALTEPVDGEARSLEDVALEAEEYVRGLQAAGEFDDA